MEKVVIFGKWWICKRKDEGHTSGQSFPPGARVNATLQSVYSDITLYLKSAISLRRVTLNLAFEVPCQPGFTSSLNRSRRTCATTVFIKRWVWMGLRKVIYLPIFRPRIWCYSIHQNNAIVGDALFHLTVSVLGLLVWFLCQLWLPMSDASTRASDETRPLLEENEGLDDHSNPQDDIETITLQKQTPLPRVQLGILCLLRVLDPMCFTQIFPYINQFMSDLRVTDDPSQIGFYSGIVVSLTRGWLEILIANLAVYNRKVLLHSPSFCRYIHGATSLVLYFCNCEVQSSQLAWHSQIVLVVGLWFLRELQVLL